MSTPSLNRRHFISATVTGAVGLASLARADEAADAKGALFREASRDLPLNSDADVIVCGAGPAGVTAAITAARTGAKVRLFEMHGALGGVWTSGLLGYLLDFDQPGFNVELVQKLRERDAIVGEGMDGLCYHPEEMKMLLEELCVAAGVQLQLHTHVAAAHCQGRQLTTVVTESKSGRQAWSASVFIDTTGDGDLGALAGCEFGIGQAPGCPCQPMSLIALVVVKDASALAAFRHGAGSNAKGLNEAKQALLAEIRRAGQEPSYGKPLLMPIRDNLMLMAVNHEYGVSAINAAQVTAATLSARAELHKIVRALKRLGGPWEGLQVAATPEQIGIREGRRIVGRYIVNKDDLIAGARHDDSVVRATFPVDIHALTAEQNKSAAVSNAGIKVQPYDIPLRALIARDVDGLMMAGRCISGDFIAHASYRVTGDSVPMGEAAGAVAAIGAQSKRQPHDVPWSEAKSAINKARSTS